MFLSYAAIIQASNVIKDVIAMFGTGEGRRVAEDGALAADKGTR